MNGKKIMSATLRVPCKTPSCCSYLRLIVTRSKGFSGLRNSARRTKRERFRTGASRRTLLAGQNASHISTREFNVPQIAA